jgi:Rap1a immunity proteins
MVKRGAMAWIPAFAGMTLVVAAAYAQPAPAPAWKQVTAKQLAADCHASDAAKHATCVGYITGIYDLQFAPTPPRGVCPPADLNPDLLAEVVVAYLDTHEDGPAPPAIGQAIVRFFPCAEGKR